MVCLFVENSFEVSINVYHLRVAGLLSPTQAVKTRWGDETVLTGAVESKSTAMLEEVLKCVRNPLHLSADEVRRLKFAKLLVYSCLGYRRSIEYPCLSKSIAAISGVNSPRGQHPSANVSIFTRPWYCFRHPYGQRGVCCVGTSYSRCSVFCQMGILIT